LLHVLDGDGTLRFSFDAGEALRVPPVVDGAGSFYLCTEAGSLLAVSDAGVLQFRAPLSAGTPLNPAAPAADGSLYLTSRTGSLLRLPAP
jgi:hypothetical protein